MPYEVRRRRGMFVEQLAGQPLIFDTAAQARAWAEGHAELFPPGLTAIEIVRAGEPIFDLAAYQAEVARRMNLSPEELRAESPPSLLSGDPPDPSSGAAPDPPAVDALPTPPDRPSTEGITVTYDGEVGSERLTPITSPSPRASVVMQGVGALGEAAAAPIEPAVAMRGVGSLTATGAPVPAATTVNIGAAALAATGRAAAVGTAAGAGRALLSLSAPDRAELLRLVDTVEARWQELETLTHRNAGVGHNSAGALDAADIELGAAALVSMRIELSEEQPRADVLRLCGQAFKRIASRIPGLILLGGATAEILHSFHMDFVTLTEKIFHLLP